MAFAQCCNCRRSDQGKLRYCYLATFDGDGRKSHRLRLCPVCYEAFVPDLLEVADLQNERGTWVTREERL